MVEHFRGRMVNEAMNMKAIAAEVAAAPASMDVTELELLTKQAQMRQDTSVWLRKLLNTSLAKR
jgi:hypothetical protein